MCKSINDSPVCDCDDCLPPGSMDEPVIETAPVKRGPATMADVAAALGCTEKRAAGRMSALGYVEACSRCGGSGNFSRCQMYGTTCFKCAGNGKQFVKLTWKIVEAAKARQDAGELADYFARGTARADAKRQIAPLMAEMEALYEPIGEAYEVAYNATRRYSDVRIPAGLCAAQQMNNSLRGAAWEAERDAKAGRLGAVAAVAILRDVVAGLTVLRAAAEPMIAGWLAQAAADAEAARPAYEAAVAERDAKEAAEKAAAAARRASERAELDARIAESAARWAAFTAQNA